MDVVRIVLLVAAAVTLGPAVVTTAGFTVAVLRAWRTPSGVPGHALSTGHIRDSRGRTAFWGCCECDPALRWHDARLPLVWALHDQHLHAVRAL